MRKFSILFLIATSLCSGEYFSRVNPINEYHIKSAVSGSVVEVKQHFEGNNADGSVIIHIDDEIDKADLNSSILKYQITKESIKLLKEAAKNTKRLKDIAYSSYQRVKNLQSYSKIQKDAKLTAYINASNAYIQTTTNLDKEKTLLSDLSFRIESLKDKIKKKNIAIKKGEFIYKIYPNVGDFVGMGARLVDSYDLSFAKLVIFINQDDLKDIKNKKIYLDGKATNYKLDKLWSIADSKNISSYKAEIIIDKPELFSRLVKIEFK